MKNVKEIVVFDFETTGLKSDTHEILEIGAIKYTKVDGKFVALEGSEIQEILLTKDPIPAIITEITNITEEMQAELGIEQSEGAKKLYELINEDTLLVAYNIQFDLGFLIEFFKKHIDPNYELKNDLLDVMAIYKDHYGSPKSPKGAFLKSNERPRHRLDDAVKTLNVNIVNTHRALDDVRATFEVLKSFRFNNEELSKYINVIGIHSYYGASGPVNEDLYEYVKQDGAGKEIWNHSKKKR